jgi:hypothetical protein
MPKRLSGPFVASPSQTFLITNVSGVTARAAAPVTPIVLPHARQVSRRVDGVVHASS